MEQLSLLDPIKIPLTQGYTTTIDPVDSDLAAFKWHISRGGKRDGLYARRKNARGKKPTVLNLHHVILSRVIGRALRPGEIADHIDGNSLNNCRSNLRVATPAENARNSRNPKTNTSGYRGVTWHKGQRKWQAGLSKSGRHIHLGLFDDPEEAHAAYCKAAVEHFGEFARFE